MSTIFDLEEKLKTGGADESQIDTWINNCDVGNAGQYFAGDAAKVYAATQKACTYIVKTFLNNSNVNEVPLRRKTRYCLLLNNFALYPPVRPAVFAALDDLTSIFESGIKEEGTMPFDSELGRMSEHVLVLLMRVTEYKLRASAVLEFAEGNTQFAVQLLLAILLKEPPYEFDLRCNCISGLLGFTQPQAFFSADAARIEEHSCDKFTEKINFMLHLMLRLQAVQVVSDVLTEALALEDTVTPTTQAAVMNTLRTIINIYKFSSQESDTWRQHLLLSTTLVDGTVMMFVQTLTYQLRQLLVAQPARAVPMDLVRSLDLCFKFGAFASYHLGEAATELRIYCTFFHDMLQLSIRSVVNNQRLSGQVMIMYTHLFHFLCNTDALAGDRGLPADELLPELASTELAKSIEGFLRKEVGGCGLAFMQAWYAQFQRVDSDISLATESATYEWIDGAFKAIMAQLTPAAQPPAPSPAQAGTTRLLGDMPPLKPKRDGKVSIEKAAAPIKLKYKINSTKKSKAPVGVDPDLLCALTGKVMKNPVKSPYGNTFEKESILNWLQENGSICPITGKPLTADQLKPNKEVANKLMQQIVRQQMAEQTQAGDDELYNF